MKKIVLVLMLVLALLMAGCANEGKDANISDDSTAAVQNESVDIKAVDEFLASVKAQSDAIDKALEEDATLTQVDMNLKATEQAELWNDAMDYMLDALKKHLSEDDYATLQNDQAEWLSKKDKAVAEAGAGFEGGSLYALIVGSEDARLTEERVFELYEMLK